MELHDQPVRASSRISAGLTLPMASSPGFGYHAHNTFRRNETNALFTLAFAGSAPDKGLDKLCAGTRWLILQ